MHPRVFEEFDRICRARGGGGDVLEIGAVASRDSLLCLAALYHRFSPQAMREVLLDGLDGREVDCVLSPPRLIGSGVVPADAA